MNSSARICRILGIVAVTGLLFSTSRLPAQPAASLGKGRLIVASEGLLDPNFDRTVVLLLDHGEAGSMGIVLNRPSRARLDRILPGLEGAGEIEEPFFVGGPVAIREMLMLFTTGEEHADQMHVLGTVYAGWDEELLERMLTKPRGGEKFRLYAGHAGWAPGQLEAEVEARGWHIFPATEAIIFAGGEEDLWDGFIRRTRMRIALVPLQGRG